MSVSARTIFLVIWCFAVVPRLWAAGGPEPQAFTAAEKVYFDADYKNAEIDFNDFIQKFPNSARLAEAVLYQAQARIKLGDFNGALSLLTARQSQAGTLADWYLLCHGEALLAKGDFAKAETDFAELNQKFPASPHRLSAVVNAAAARMRQAKWAQVIDVLATTNGIFQLTAATNHASSDVIRGYLLLSEAQLAQKDTHAAEQSLQYLAASPLDPTNNWQRQFLLCRVLLTANRLEESLQNSTNLQILAEATGNKPFQGQTIAFQAALLERMGRLEDAAAAYQKNLAPGIPIERQREALLKTTQLWLATDKISEATQVLQNFLTQFPTNECSDLALLTLGELHLHQYQPGALTNTVTVAVTKASGPKPFLDQAIAAFQNLSARFPKSGLRGKAQLDLGWCYWLGGQIRQSQTAFETAVTLLPNSAEQAQAYFKLADAQFQLTNYAGAISNYSAVADRFPAVPEVQTNLAEAALYQTVRACQASGDEAQETNVLSRIMTAFPNGLYTQRAVLLAGQHMGQRFPAVARSLFAEAARNATNSALLPDLQLAVARTYEEEARWGDAIQQYDAWLTRFTNHQAKARAEYFRALANYNAGNETNALLQFTNLISRFPTNEFAPLAQWWVADYFYNAGNILEAERNYMFVFQNYGSSPLAYKARMMAARMAVQRQDWSHAPAYFLALYNDQNCPEDLRAQALDAYGDTFLMQNSPKGLSDYQEAFKTFDLVCKTFPTNPIATLAWGQKAICWLQFARTSQEYGPVTNAFQQVIDSPLADAKARSIAEVGLGFTMEKIAETKADPEKLQILNEALRHYQRVFYNKGFLRDGEKPDEFWTRKAGIDEADLAKRLQMRDHAISVYRRLQQMFPPLRLDEKIKTLQAQE
jgi:TolA-binding protein